MKKFGIDISEWQGKIDWDVVKNKVDFAIRNGKPYKQNVAFLCDRERECNKSINCGKECHHTFDVEHAVNFPITENAAGEKYFVEKGR